MHAMNPYFNEFLCDRFPSMLHNTRIATIKPISSLDLLNLYAESVRIRYSGYYNTPLIEESQPKAY